MKTATVHAKVYIYNYSKDCVHVQLYRDSKDRLSSGQTKASLSLQYFLAVQAGFTLDKESNTIAILCEDVTVIFAFDTREQLIQWQAKIAINLGEDDQFSVQICSVPPRSKLVPGPARLHVLERRFCLTEGVPPRLLGHWQIAHLRKYGAINNRFCFEGGSQCGRGEGVHVLLTDQAEAVARAFQESVRGATPFTSRALSRYHNGRERSISSSRTESNICDISFGRNGRSRSQENVCWDSTEDWSEGLTSTMDFLRSGCGEDSVRRPRCRSCHVKLARSSTVTCDPGAGFTWTMEPCGGFGRSSSSGCDPRTNSNSATVRSSSVVEVHSPGFPPPRPPKTKPSSPEDSVQSVTKRPRPSPSMPTISRCGCSSYRQPGSDIIMETGEDYYDTPRSFRNTIIDHSCRIKSCNAGSCFCHCGTSASCGLSHSTSQRHIGFESQLGHSHRDLSLGFPQPKGCSFHNEEEPTSLSSDPGWPSQFGAKSDIMSCSYHYMNSDMNSFLRNKRCVKSVTFSELPQSVLRSNPNYVNIDFAESLKFYENCKDCHSKLLKEGVYNDEMMLNRKRSLEDFCSSCSNYLRGFDFKILPSGIYANRPIPEDSPGYIKMSSLAIMKSDNSSQPNEKKDVVKLKTLIRSKSSTCLYNGELQSKSFTIRSISDPEIHLIPSIEKRSKIALSKIIDLIRNVRPITAQEIHRHARKSNLANYTNRSEDRHYQSDDTLSSETMVNTANDMSSKGSLNSLSSDVAHHIGVTRFISASELNISIASLGDRNSSLEGNKESDIERYKNHLKSLKLPPLPTGTGYNKHDTCCTPVRRSCTTTFKPGHNRDSSSSNDSGVSTASLRLRRTDSTEFEMPITNSLSVKLLREYALAGRTSSDLSLPRRSKSIDPLGDLRFQFQEGSSSAKSTSALLAVSHGKDGKLLRFIDAPSTSSGTSDLSDYMDNLSLSSYSSNDHQRMTRCTTTTLKPRSGKEYHKIGRLNVKHSEEGTSCSPNDQQAV